ncbi:hypothetical protein I316_00113 [Kwoniella heveanensis BCC8398]|uniref:Uncharacterized protein n=1 Tax=Kwoniella heveanensis BCC8398 TaxID=1296120 RepID=A0A1B9H3P4_9TREE|nr:hypothetical protein I316_00113 [Kwoniella heveanensis BCC8398]
MFPGHTRSRRTPKTNETSSVRRPRSKNNSTIIDAYSEVIVELKSKGEDLEGRIRSAEESLKSLTASNSTIDPSNSATVGGASTAGGDNDAHSTAVTDTFTSMGRTSSAFTVQGDTTFGVGSSREHTNHEGAGGPGFGHLVDFLSANDAYSKDGTSQSTAVATDVDCSTQPHETEPGNQ